MSEQLNTAGPLNPADPNRSVDSVVNKSNNDQNCQKSAQPMEIHSNIKSNASDSEGFLSTSPDSANGDATMELTTKSSIMANGDDKFKLKSTNGIGVKEKPPLPPPVCLCTNPTQCVTLRSILDSFKSPLSEEQAWALIFQFVSLYQKIAAAGVQHVFHDLEIPDDINNVSVHRDGQVHCSWTEDERRDKKMQMLQEHRPAETTTVASLVASHKKILRKIACIVYHALDYNLSPEEQCQMSIELEEVFTIMTAEDNEDDCIDEGIDEGDKRWEDDSEDGGTYCETKEFDVVLEACRNHVKPTVPEDHYKAVCRALVTETIELRIFLHHVLNNNADDLHSKVDPQTSRQELAKLGFNDWARFWVQVIDELRRGVRLKKNNYTYAPIEYELTPYEILMEDIRSKRYQLRKVMVNGDIPPRVKKDAHALILEFIRSRPPLKKASERQLPPPVQRTPSPREQLMDSIRKGRPLKHIQPPNPNHLHDHLLSTSSATSTDLTTATSATATTTATAANPQQQTLDALKLQEEMEANTMPRSKQRLIKVDFSLLQDDDTSFFDDVSSANTSLNIGMCSRPKMPPYPIVGYMVADSTGAGGAPTTGAPVSGAAPVTTQIPTALTTRVLRRTTYDLATQCESRRASLRRHTIVGCQSNFEETHSMPPSRPGSRQSDVNASTGNTSGAVSTTKQLHNTYNQHQQQQQQQQQHPNLKRSQSPGNSSSRSSSSVGRPWNKSFMDEKTWNERADDRLSLTLEEIVHIRSVMTKAELEGLPVGVRVKEDVEKRKVCFLCLRTRFSIFGPWGIQCKLCQRTVCSKCYTKMRIPSEHFRNVPLVLISPSLLASPAGSSTPSPSHHAHHMHSSSTGNILDETFPKSLIERLLRSESDRKARNSVGSAPSSPKHQRSNMSTPGTVAGTSASASSGNAAAAGQAVEAIHDASVMTSSYTASNAYTSAYGPPSLPNGGYKKINSAVSLAQANNKHISLMSRSMEGPRSLPANSPARTHSNSSTLERKSKFSRAFALSSSGTQLSQEQKENLRGEQVPVCNDCRGLVEEITRSSKQTRSSARNRTLQNLTLDLSPVYK